LSAAEYKHILRIAGKDIEGSKKVIVALSKVKGVGYNFAHVLLQSLNINPNSRVGFLTDRELTDIEAAIRDPSKARMPEWYLNRRKDMDTGSDRHLITSDLDFMISNDIDREKTIMSWRGYRHRPVYKNYWKKRRCSRSEKNWQTYAFGCVEHSE
jgi:small subunit ribosomal protein S13